MYIAHYPCLVYERCQCDPQEVATWPVGPKQYVCVCTNGTYTLALHSCRLKLCSLSVLLRCIYIYGAPTACCVSVWAPIAHALHCVTGVAYSSALYQCCSFASSPTVRAHRLRCLCVRTNCTCISARCSWG
jgi:hypothetical protein